MSDLFTVSEEDGNFWRTHLPGMRQYILWEKYQHQYTVVLAYHFINHKLHFTHFSLLEFFKKSHITR